MDTAKGKARKARGREMGAVEVKVKKVEQMNPLVQKRVEKRVDVDH
jgi:hypothetical protein